MFKKFSVFLAPELRDVLSQNLRKARGFALAFPGDFVRMISTRACSVEDMPSYMRVHLGFMHQHFDGTHANFGGNYYAMDHAYRIETYITRISGEEAVRGEMKFYARGKGEPFYTFYADFYGGGAVPTGTREQPENR